MSRASLFIHSLFTSSINKWEKKGKERWPHGVFCSNRTGDPNTCQAEHSHQEACNATRCPGEEVEQTLCHWALGGQSGQSGQGPVFSKQIFHVLLGNPVVKYFLSFLLTNHQDVLELAMCPLTTNTSVTASLTQWQQRLHCPLAPGKLESLSLWDRNNWCGVLSPLLMEIISTLP